MAAKASAKLMRVVTSDSAGFEEAWKADLWTSRRQRARRREGGRQDHRGSASGGDKALLAFVKKFDGARSRRSRSTNDEWDEACEQVDSADRAAIGKAAMRVREFHRKRIPSSWEMREEGGGYMGQRVRPLSRVGHLRARRQGGLSVLGDHERDPRLGRRGARDRDGDAARQGRHDSSRGPDGRARGGRPPRLQDGGRPRDGGPRLRDRGRPARRQDHRPRQRLGRDRQEAGLRSGRHRQRGRSDRGLRSSPIAGDARLDRRGPDLPGRARRARAGGPDHPREGARRPGPGADRPPAREARPRRDRQAVAQGDAARSSRRRASRSRCGSRTSTPPSTSSSRSRIRRRPSRSMQNAGAIFLGPLHAGRGRATTSPARTTFSPQGERRASSRRSPSRTS